MKRIYLGLLYLTYVFVSLSVEAGISEELQPLQEQWAHINYEMSGDAQLTAFEQLESDLDALVQQYPNMAEGYIWRGIVQSTYAGAIGGMGALGLAKKARENLEQALEIEPTALHGSAFASLGTLYYKVPGWPISFGNKRKAKEYLEEALAISSESIDNNYFYADFLFEIGEYDDARAFALRALNTPARDGRPIADVGRRAEIELLLSKIDERA